MALAGCMRERKQWQECGREKDYSPQQKAMIGTDFRSEPQAKRDSGGDYEALPDAGCEGFCGKAGEDLEDRAHFHIAQRSSASLIALFRRSNSSAVISSSPRRDNNNFSREFPKKRWRI